MTNKIALGLIFAVLLFLVIDAGLFEKTAALFLGKKFLALLNYLAFWR